MAKKILDAPKRMGEKVKEIRLRMDLTQEQMYNLLINQGAKIYLGYVGLYENNDRLPSHKVTLAYARVAGVCCDVLIDDELDLPKKLPSKPKHS